MPVNDNRLDFLIADAKSLINDRNVLKKNQELFLGYVLLTPSKSGLLESKIIISATG